MGISVENLPSRCVCQEEKIQQKENQLNTHYFYWEKYSNDLFVTISYLMHGILLKTKCFSEFRLNELCIQVAVTKILMCIYKFYVLIFSHFC